MSAWNGVVVVKKWLTVVFELYTVLVDRCRSCQKKLHIVVSSYSLFILSGKRSHISIDLCELGLDGTESGNDIITILEFDRQLNGVIGAQVGGEHFRQIIRIHAIGQLMIILIRNKCLNS